MAETSCDACPSGAEGARRDLTSAPPRLQGRSAGENHAVPRFFHPVAAPVRRITGRRPNRRSPMFPAVRRSIRRSDKSRIRSFATLFLTSQMIAMTAPPRHDRFT
ncbi:hypothetical protein [Azospirillum endophyticum]